MKTKTQLHAGDCFDEEYSRLFWEGHARCEAIQCDWWNFFCNRGYDACHLNLPISAAMGAAAICIDRAT